MVWPFEHLKHEYQAVASDEVESPQNEAEQREQKEQRLAARRQGYWFRVGAAALLLLLSAIGITTIVATQTSPIPETSTSSSILETPTSSSILESTTSTPAVELEKTPPQPSPTSSRYCPPRREWRTLYPVEKKKYISAVLCLLDKPSSLNWKSSENNENRTAYADYPFIHSHRGYRTHHSASFLPWHRYFLHVYEETLRDKCGYDGGLVYWDWTLDAPDQIENAPVFDPETGFGGDGDPEGERTVSNTGRCVIDGPFAGKVTADYYDVRYQPHCLSRGFRDMDGSLGHIDGHEITPESIEEVLSLPNYQEFVTLMESRVHDAIPYGISGDFETFTAPYDPLFFLHHVQLDRLWWLWQQRQPDGGFEAYEGHKERHSPVMASLDDKINLLGLAPDVKVKEVMNIESGDLLCYTYS